MSIIIGFIPCHALMEAGALPSEAQVATPATKKADRLIEPARPACFWQRANQS
ncbi:MAG TPA: hypothetical protein IAA99_07810 [Candidatus Avibacteroides faecavium]|nr:hypothetical protein [Candidatus Avibacteroides faecavium]